MKRILSLLLTYVNGHWDNYIYEYEIRAVKNAGFNYIGLELDFAWLQDYQLFSGRKGPIRTAGIKAS